MAIDWGQLRRLADQQHDLLTRRQCLTAGMSGKAVEWRVRSRRWVRLHPGVFLTRPGRDDWHTSALAALLSADSDADGADAALCGASAAYLWGLQRHPPAVVELVVPYRRTIAETRRTRVRRSMRWDNLIHETAYPWRTTLPATVVDMASRGSAADALSIVAKAVQKELTTANELRQEIRARGGHRYSRLLLPALADIDDGAQSGAEVLYLRDVERAHGLPRSVLQSPTDVGRRRFHDFGYEEYDLVVEVDGRLGHEKWSDRVRDGRRDRQLLTTSRLTTRVFYTDVAVTPCDTAGEVGAILDARGWLGSPHPCRRAGCTLRSPSL
jgi:hypothetical protein